MYCSILKFSNVFVLSFSDVNINLSNMFLENPLSASLLVLNETLVTHLQKESYFLNEDCQKPCKSCLLRSLTVYVLHIHSSTNTSSCSTFEVLECRMSIIWFSAVSRRLLIRISFVFLPLALKPTSLDTNERSASLGSIVCVTFDIDIIEPFKYSSSFQGIKRFIFSCSCRKCYDDNETGDNLAWNQKLIRIFRRVNYCGSLCM